MRVFKILLIIIIVFTISFFSISKLSNGYLSLEIESVVFKVKIADSPLEWRRGLSNIISLGEKEGMLFIFPYSEKRIFHMKDMNFTLDLLWIKDKIVVGMEKNMFKDNGERKYNSEEEIDMVLELEAGSIDKYNLKIGNIIKIN